MPITRTDLKRVFRGAQSRIESDQTYYGKLGKLNDAGTAITLNDSLTDPNLVWVRLNGADSQPVVALCVKVARKPNSNVILRLNQNRRLEVIATDTVANVSDFGELAGSLNLPPFTGEGVDGRWTEANLAPRVYPSSAGGLYVTIEAFDYDGGSWGGGDLNLAPFLPAGADSRAAVIVCIDTSDGSATAVTGSERSLAYAFTHADATAETIPAGYIPVWFFVLADDQVGITGATQNEPLRYRLGRKGGMGGAPTDATYITQTPSAGLSAEQALSTLTTGQLRVTTGTGIVSSLKDNIGATVAPTVNDDSGDGYSVGSRWYDTTNDKEYACLDATLGAAIWLETTTGGGGTVDDSARFLAWRGNP